MSLDSPNRKRESACGKPLFYRDTRYQLGKLSDNRVTRSRKITAAPRSCVTDEPVIFLPRITRIFTNMKVAQYSCLLVIFVAMKICHPDSICHRESNRAGFC